MVLSLELDSHWWPRRKSCRTPSRIVIDYYHQHNCSAFHFAVSPISKIELLHLDVSACVLIIIATCMPFLLHSFNHLLYYCSWRNHKLISIAFCNHIISDINCRIETHPSHFALHCGKTWTCREFAWTVAGHKRTQVDVFKWAVETP